jgi:hypothetical protein
LHLQYAFVMNPIIGLLSVIALKEPGMIGLKEPLRSGDFGVSERAID